MTRKNSSCKLRTLVFTCSVRQAPLYAIAFLAMLIFQPVYTLLDIRSRTRFSDMSDAYVYNSIMKDLHDALIANFPTAGLLIVLALIAGIGVFRYLHVKNQTDFFHALPIRRGQLFASHVLTGILAVIPAYIVGVLLSCAVIAAHGYGEILSVQEILLSILLHSTGFLLVYAVAVLSAIVCGNTLVSILVCAWFQFGILVGWAGLDSVLYVLMPARTHGAAVSLWSSPAAAVFEMLGGLSDETISYVQLGKQTANCLIAVIVIFALAYFLNHIRASENTGMSLAFPALQIPFKVYMMSVVGIFGGLFFENMTGSWGMLFVGMAIGIFLTACVVEIVYDMDFHSLFHHWKGTMIYAAAVVVVMGALAFDAFGWNSRLPDRSEIVSAQLISDHAEWACTNDTWSKGWDYADFDHGMMGNMYTEPQGYSTVYGSNVDPDQLLDIADIQPLKESKNIDYVYASAQLGAQEMKHGRSRISNNLNQYDEYGDNLYATYLVRFQLANGKTFERQYAMPVDTKELTDNADAVRYTKEYLSTNTPEAVAQSRKSLAKVIDVYGYKGKYTDSKHINNKQAIDAVLDTLQKESLQRDQTYIDSHAPEYYLRVRGAIEESMYGNGANVDTSGDDIITIPVYSYETQTIALLSKYVDAMPETFGADSIAKIRVITDVSDEGEEKYQDFTQAADIAKLLPAVIPTDFENYLDGAVYHQASKNYHSTTVYMKDGQTIACGCYLDRTGGLVS
jgi:hypothetical protein